MPIFLFFLLVVVVVLLLLLLRLLLHSPTQMLRELILLILLRPRLGRLHPQQPAPADLPQSAQIPPKSLYADDVPGVGQALAVHCPSASKRGDFLEESGRAAAQQGVVSELGQLDFDALGGFATDLEGIFEPFL